MDNAHKLWQEAVDSGKEVLAGLHMEDYTNYKELYDGKLSKS